jgi:Replication-relaxation
LVVSRCAERGPRPYLTARGAVELRARLSDRDLAILRHVAELRLMSARQIEAVHFPPGEHGSQSAATRARQRVIARLLRDRLLMNLARRIGGIRAGSAGLVLGLGPAAVRVLRLDGPRRRAHEPGARFVEHTLAVSQLMVELIVAGRAGQLELLDWQAEPRCWRVVSGLAGRQRLRPDAFVTLGVGAYELRWFVEVDRATESLPTVLGKCRLYAAYYQSGAEQAKHGVFPRVVWIVPDEARAARLRRAIERARLPERLFVVTATAQALAALTVTEIPLAENKNR